MLGIFSTALRHKVWFDLWGAKQRTAQAILTIAIGSFVIGAIYGGWGGIAEDTRDNYAPTRPPAIDLRLSPPADEALLDALRADPLLEEVDGVLEARIRWRPAPGAAWRPATLLARDDYRAQRLAILQLEGGAWPSGRQIAVERGFAIAPGGTVELEIADRAVAAPVGGVIYNLGQPSASLGGDPTIYATRSEFARLTGQGGFTRIIATVPGYTAERAAAAAERIQARLRDEGFAVQPGSLDGAKVVNPNRAFFQDPIEGVGLILQSIGIIAVALGLLLVYNTVMAIVAQQTAQIGELKAIGATSREILVVYAAIVLAYGAVALLISAPLGALAANALRRGLVSMLGLTPAEWIILPAPILYQVAICLAAPLAVATIPVLRGARITVREAISSYGLRGGGGADSLLARAPWLPKVIQMALSNALSNPARVITTQIALAGAGMTFMAVVSARAALIFTLGGVLAQSYPYQIQIGLAERTSLARAEQIGQAPGVAGVEAWRQQSATIRRAGAPEGIRDPSALLSGVPLPTASYTPVILQGRGLRQGDTRAIVLHEWLAKDIGVRAGDWVVVSIPDERGERRWASQERWQVVGVLLDATMRGGALVPREALFDEIGRREVNRLQVRSADPSDEGVAATAARVRAFAEARGVEVVPSRLETVAQRTEAQLSNLSSVLGLLLLVSLIVAGVGAISLNGTLAIGVLERRREIGVLRAIGATPQFIRTQLVTEGLVMGLLSWLIALICSYPVGVATAQLVGAAVRISVIFQFAWEGVWLWLLLATLIAVVASLSPAQQAIRMRVQESLAYE